MRRGAGLVRALTCTPPTPPQRLQVGDDDDAIAAGIIHDSAEALASTSSPATTAADGSSFDTRAEYGDWLPHSFR